MSKMMKADSLHNSIYFYVTVRGVALLCCVITLFCVALTSGWSDRVPAIIGLVFTLLAMLAISTSVATLFTWDMRTMGLVKRSIFVWIFLLMSLIAAVMFVLAPAMCQQLYEYGCFETSYSTGLKCAAAFSFINVFLALLDVALHFVFYIRERREDEVAPRPDSIADSDSTVPRPEVRASLPVISVIDTTLDPAFDPYTQHIQNKSTYV